MEISNKFLAFLLVIAIVISVFGTLYSTWTITRITWITPHVVTGIVNVTITNQTSLNVTETNCDFSSGYISIGYPSARLESNGTKINWTGSGSQNNDSLLVENNGNVNITVNVSSNASLNDFYETPGCDAGSPACNVTTWSVNNKTGSCSSGLLAYPGSQIDNSTNVTVCTNLQSDDTKDTIFVRCGLFITTAVTTGDKVSTWTFYYEQS